MDILVKAMGKKDLSKLIKKLIVDKRGRKQTVWVRPDDETPEDLREKKIFDKAKEKGKELRTKVIDQLKDMLEVRTSLSNISADHYDIIDSIKEMKKSEEKAMKYISDFDDAVNGHGDVVGTEELSDKMSRVKDKILRSFGESIGRQFVHSEMIDPAYKEKAMGKIYNALWQMDTEPREEIVRGMLKIPGVKKYW